jgi:hypothetical protein
MRIHTFDNTTDAYNDTQTLESISDGDVLVVPSENVVGVLVEAWPVAVTAEVGQFHMIASRDALVTLGAMHQSRIQDAEDVARVIGARLRPEVVDVVTEDNTPRCTCEWADDAGNPEVGPDPYIDVVDEACPVPRAQSGTRGVGGHGRVGPHDRRPGSRPMKALFTVLTIAGATFASSVGAEVFSVLHTINQIGCFHV